jgi:hypothetical protein
MGGQVMIKSKTMKIRAIFPFLLITFGLTWGIASLLIFSYDQVVAIFMVE